MPLILLLYGQNLAIITVQFTARGVQMMRRSCWCWIVGIILASWNSLVPAQGPGDVFSANQTDPPTGWLYRWLQDRAREHFDQRRLAIRTLKSPEDVRQRQQMLKQKFVTALGGFPEKTPLNPVVTGRLERGEFSVEKVIYESRPQHHVSACLYLPKGTGPFPGVLVPCGHSVNGKANEGYQRACISMARNGIAVLCYDPIGQGERVQLLDAMGKPALPGSTSEHTLVGVGALLVGSSCATYRIWDGIRSLDYLASRPEIDPKRLGCTGNSGGGTLTSYLMALDERIIAAAPSCYLTTLEKLFATIGPQDAEQNITGQVAFGMEHTDYVTMRAPAPTLICVGTQDYFNIDGAWTTFREAKSIYGILGYGERVDLFEYNDPHGFSLPRRQASLRWMRRWLLSQDDAPFESDFPVFTDADLQVTRTGQVLEDFKGLSAFDLTRLEAESLTAGRKKTTLSREEFTAAVRSLIHLPENIPIATGRDEGKPVEQNDSTVERLILETEPGIRLPGHLWRPNKPNLETDVILYLSQDGKSAAAMAGGDLERLVKSGRTVLAVDLRGIGELSPQGAKGNNSLFGSDSREAFLALHLDRPLLGQRVTDVLSLVEYICTHVRPGRKVEINATGSVCPIVQHAGLFTSQISAVQLQEGTTSWTDVILNPTTRNQLTNVVPGALKVYDLTDLPHALK